MVDKSTKRRRRRRPAALSCLLATATAALSCLTLTSIVVHHNDDVRSPIRMVAQALSLSHYSTPRLSTAHHGTTGTGTAVHNANAWHGSIISQRPSSSLLITRRDNISYGHGSRMATALSAESRLDSKSISSQTARPNRRSNSPNHSNDNDNNNNNKHVNGSNQDRESPTANGNRNGNGDSWLDRTTARILQQPQTEQNENDDIPTEHYLTPDDVALITTLMTSHARRSTVESALICERLLKRVVEEVNAGNDAVRVTTKMYTVAMDAWAKSQRRPLPGSGLNKDSDGKNNSNKNNGNHGDNNNKGSSNNSSLKGRERKRNQGPFGFEGKESENSKPTNQTRRINIHQQHQQHRQQQHSRQTHQQLQLHPQQDPTTSKLSQLPLGAAAQRAHRIHNSLVQTHKETGDVHLAPSTISYNAAINAWSKSYHPSAGEMAELLLGEMMREWRFGDEVMIEGKLDTMSMNDEYEEMEGEEEIEVQVSTEGNVTASVPSKDVSSGSKPPKKVGNQRVKPDVVTFTAVIDAWVKCTALAHDYHYERPPTAHTSESSDATNSKNNTSNYIDWKRSQAAKADELTQRAALRAKQLLELMIVLGHYDPERHGDEQSDVKAGDAVSDNNANGLIPLTKCEPGMRPNCYTYSAVMNALAKSCSALRVHGGTGSGGGRNNGNNNNRGGRDKHHAQKQQQQYDPAKEAQDMLENMIIKHERYRERVGVNTNGASVGYGTSRSHYDDDDNVEDRWLPEVDNDNDGEDEKENLTGGAGHEEWMKDSWSSTSLEDADNVEDDESVDKDPNWFQPRPDEMTFPPNTINYNSVLNAWSRASRYDPLAAQRAEQILLERMELPQAEGGDNIEPDALSYSLVIHAWLRGCRGLNNNDSSGRGASSGGYAKSASRQKRQSANCTDQDRIEKAMKIVDHLEAWVRRTHSRHKWQGNQKGFKSAVGNEDDSDEDDVLDDDEAMDTSEETSSSSRTASTAPSYTLRQRYDKARDLDVEVYNSILVAYSREQSGDHAHSVIGLLDRMENLASELDMPSVRPNMRSYNVALGVISNSATRMDTTLAEYYKDADKAKKRRDAEKLEAKLASEPIKKLSGSRKDRSNQKSKNKPKTNTQKPQRHPFNPLYAGRAAESILSRMLARDFRPDAYTFASVLNTYQRIPNGRLDAALSADAVVRGMESLYLHGDIDEPPDVFHYTMVCACWSRSGEKGVAGERCSEILKHMQQRDHDGFPRVRPNIRTYNAVIDSHAYNGRVAEAEDMLLSMVDNYESSASRSMDGIQDEELPIRPDSFSFNTVIQQWARSRTPEGGRRAEFVLDRMLKFHHDGNADVRPDERSFAYIIYHFTKGAGRMSPDAPDRALKLLRRMVGMYQQGYKELLPAQQNKTNPIFAFTSVVDAHSVLRRSDSGIVGDELLNSMTKLGLAIESLRPNTYACLSVLYAWSSCGSIDAGEHATALLKRMEEDMAKCAKRGWGESIMRTTQRCYILAQTAWARSPSENKAEGALEVLEMMEKNFKGGNVDAKPTVQAYSMVLNACAFADTVQDKDSGKLIKASRQAQQKAFHIAELTMDRIRKSTYHNVSPNPVIYGSFIKCCGRLDLPSETLAGDGAIRAFGECCQAGLVSDFVLTQLRYALSPETFLKVLAKNGFDNLDGRGKSLSRDGKRIRHIRISELPKEWTRNANADNSNRRNNRS